MIRGKAWNCSVWSFMVLYGLDWSYAAMHNFCACFLVKPLPVPSKLTKLSQNVLCLAVSGLGHSLASQVALKIRRGEIGSLVTSLGSGKNIPQRNDVLIENHEKTSFFQNNVTYSRSSPVDFMRVFSTFSAFSTFLMLSSALASASTSKHARSIILPEFVTILEQGLPDQAFIYFRD